MTENNEAGTTQPETPQTEPAEQAAPVEAQAPEAAPPPPPDPLVVAQEDLKRTRDQLLRTAADFDNFRKRARRDVDDAQRRGSEEMLKSLLPVFDNLERAATHAEQSAEQSNEAKAIAEGVRMVLKQLGDTLGRMNIQRVPGVGSPFDPLVHEAIQQLESADHAPGTIMAEVAPGYLLGEKLIRAAMVVVAKPKSS